MKQDVTTGPPKTATLAENGAGGSHRDDRRRSRRARFWLWMLLGAFFVVVVIVAVRNHSSPAAKGKAKAGNPPMPVVVDDVTKGDMPVYITGLGTVTPLYTVTVKTRVDGQLMKVLYHEGQNVRQGDPLVEIDTRPYEVQLAQAQAQLAKDQAALQNAKTDLARYQTLIKRNAVAEQTLATQEATVAQDEAIVKTDEANVASAKLNIAYCHIISPVAGRVGLRLVDPGNMVYASAGTALAVVTQIEPMSVLFTVPEQYVAPIFVHARKSKLAVDAFDREMKTRIASGELSTADNEIDPSTGTLKVRAVYPNKDEQLFPNQFVNARLLLETHRGVALVPNAAIQRNANRTFVYLVKPDNTVTIRDIAVDATDSDRTQVISGLNPGDIVVTQGVDRLTEGGKVVPQHPGQTAPSAGGNTGANTGGHQTRRGRTNQ
jgi:multidrug efflux system membrane fusion protein